MADDQFNYRPRHGFDIRIKPTKGSKNSKKSWAKTETRTCDHEGCDKPAETRAPKSPDQMNQYLWLCTAHAREHNKNWNFFEGKTDAQAAQLRDAARYGERPTWKMSKNGRAAAAARAGMHGFAEIDDAVGAQTRIDASSGDDGVYREGRRLTRLQLQAFRTMNLKPNSSNADVRKRYAELVKRFHPDSNEGDRSAEAQLQEVIKAHQILKKAGFC
ncbi:J domain-containing protein [Parvularcula lutaonensis]|uniref:J domain-containing protein n=1 Tax=Parvularcula lutaonensis TaxID=491923 RepID=A0ABV7M7T1_9PROT|nr:DnaJ domain-containing protein [Parvularcula lutaonensis]GGY42990.1 molecular chaperone DnaJ [Parvularcula lutaonensis]